MVNNIDIIKPFLKFNNSNDFYFIQILQRSKDNPELGNNNRLIKPYYIYLIEQLDKFYPEMVTLANTFNARVMIHLNKRNSWKIALEMMEDLAHNINYNQVNGLHKLYSSVCGKHHSDEKSWIVDIDNNDVEFDIEIQEFINSLQPEGMKILGNIPTKSGHHLITRPFNSKVFQEKYPDIEIHRNNPTVLFCP